MEEVWKDVPGYEGLYIVSNFGSVVSMPKRITKSKFRNEIKTLSQYNINGYLFVTLCKNGSRNIRVHRIVALSFIPNPENKKEVNHINAIKTDNKVDNLEWCTGQENRFHSIKHKLRSGVGIKKLSKDQVKQIRLCYTCKRGDITKLSMEYGVSQRTISFILKNKTRKVI